jgi:PTH1 family peptidyl-tRNA hydrolase
VILLGLGNPGEEYGATRHNAGFMLADAARRRWGAAPWREREHGQECRIRFRTLEHRVVRPTTFMNRSGLIVEALIREGARPEELLVLLDDIDLPLGRIRIRLAGGAGGHRGLQSILAAVAPAQVARLRMGVGRPPAESGVVDHVLEPFDEEERSRLNAVMERCLDALGLILGRGFEAAMNHYNGLPAPWEKAGAAPMQRKGAPAREGPGLDKPGADRAK